MAEMEETYLKDPNEIKRFNIVITNTAKVLYNIINNTYTNLIDKIAITKLEDETYFSNKITVESAIFNGYDLDIVFSNDYSKKEVDVYLNASTDTNSDDNFSSTEGHFSYHNILDLQSSVIELDKYIGENYLDPEKSKITKISDDVLRNITLISYFIPLGFHGTVDNIYNAISDNIEFPHKDVGDIIVDKINSLTPEIIESLRSNQHLLVTRGSHSFLFLAPFKDEIIVNLNEDIDSETDPKDLADMIDVQGILLNDPVDSQTNPLSNLMSNLG